MYQRQLEFPKLLKKSFFLFGPRGTGKTLWVKSNFPHALYFDLLDTSVYTELLAHPEKLEQKISNEHEDWVVIDEIQKIPQLLNEVHRLIESRRIKFVLTGSSARILRKKGVNLLAGRAYTFHLYPLTCWELGTDFNLCKALQHGLMPSVYNEEEDPNLYLKSYIETYLREEILQEGLTRNLSAFSRFLEVASFSQGETLNMTAIGRDASLSRKVVENYLQILEDLLIGYRIPVFTKRAKRQLISHPKFYFFDVGVYQILRPKGPWDTPEILDGPALETLFLSHVLALNAYRQLEYQTYYWRTSYGKEVDFILFGPKGIFAFEIKRTRTISFQDLKALRLFCEDYPEAKAYLLAGVSQPEYYDKITVLPFEQALEKLPQILNSQ